jgi:Bacterial CdiA-CT RNAse A domain
MKPVPTPVAAPTQYVVPTIHGDPAAAYRLAAACRELAESIDTVVRRTSHVIGELSIGWRGQGRRGIDAPTEAFVRQAVGLVQRLRDTAAELDAYGHHLAKAQHHHGFSLHKLLVVGAVVVVSGAALIVTVGAAGVVEAAAATAAVGGATEAASAAVAADVAAAAELDAALDGVASMRPLLAFAVPHLVQVTWASGAMALDDEVTTGRLDWRGIAETGAIAFVASGSAARATTLASDSTWLSRAPARLSTAMPQLIEGATWASAAAGDDALVDHRFSLADISESFVLAGGSGPARDAMRDRGLWPAERDYRREALINLSHQKGFIVNPLIAHELSVLRQSAAELHRGEIDLRLQEGPGHTLDRHVSKSAGELLARVRTGKIPIASTYWDETTAKDAVRATMAARSGVVDRWIAAGSTGTLRLHLRLPYDIGFAVDAGGRVRFVRETVVILRRDHAGVLMRTSYPVVSR